MEAAANIRFGEFVLNRKRGCLEDGLGTERFLRPKSYRVLEVLAERRGQLVSKDDLVLLTWPDVIVSDDSLAHCISDIRRAIGPERAQLLRTVPRRGYMLVSDSDAPKMLIQPILRPRPAWTVGVIAALTLAMAGVWSTSSQAPVVVTQVKSDVLMMKADALLKARDWQRREHNEQARTLLEAVLAKNANHVEALASLGLTYWLEVKHLAWGGGRREMDQALDKVERAAALGGSSRTHRLLAEMRLLAPFPEVRSPVDALASARAAVAIGPEDPDNLAILAHALALTGHAVESVRTIEKARRLTPNAPEWYREIAGLGYMLAGEPAQAAEEFGPLYGSGTFASARWWPGWLFAASLAHAGRIDEATAIVHTARQRRPEESIAGVAQSFDGFVDGADLAVVLDGLRLAGLPG